MEEGARGKEEGREGKGGEREVELMSKRGGRGEEGGKEEKGRRKRAGREEEGRRKRGGREEEARRKGGGSEEEGRSTNLPSNERLSFCPTPPPLLVFSEQTLGCGPWAAGGRNISQGTTMQSQRGISYL